jgi:hypothetical protein
VASKVSLPTACGFRLFGPWKGERNAALACHVSVAWPCTAQVWAVAEAWDSTSAARARAGAAASAAPIATAVRTCLNMSAPGTSGEDEGC